MTDEKKRIGQQIAELRNSLGISQSELDRRLYASHVVCNWERGHSMPRADSICDLCKALHCTPNELFDWKETENENQ